MQTTRSIEVLASLASLTLVAMLGCAPSPEKVCAHILDLEKKEDANHPSPFADEGECTKQTQKIKDKNPEGWSECAKCAMAAETKKAIGDCKVCAPKD